MAPQAHPPRTVITLAGGNERCVYAEVTDHGPEVTVFRHSKWPCDRPTRGLVVDLPLPGTFDEVVRVQVCRRHAVRLWEVYGPPRGEEPWITEPVDAEVVEE